MQIMLVHNFIMVRRKMIKRNIPYTILKNRTGVNVEDDIILNNIQDFSNSFRAHWFKIGNYEYGLNYYGPTIILNEDLPIFINVLHKYKNYQSIEDLIELCEKALTKNRDIIHFGI